MIFFLFILRADSRDVSPPSSWWTRSGCWPPPWCRTRQWSNWGWLPPCSSPPRGCSCPPAQPAGGRCGRSRWGAPRWAGSRGWRRRWAGRGWGAAEWTGGGGWSRVRSRGWSGCRAAAGRRGWSRWSSGTGWGLWSYRSAHLPHSPPPGLDAQNRDCC